LLFCGTALCVVLITRSARRSAAYMRNAYERRDQSYGLLFPMERVHGWRNSDCVKWHKSASLNARERETLLT
jgi:hypothetical protein